MAPTRSAEVLSSVPKCKKEVMCLNEKNVRQISFIQAQVQQYTLKKMSLKETHVKQCYVLH